MKSVGLVILNHKNFDFISTLSEDLKKQELPYKICIVDNSENEDEIKKIRQLISDLPTCDIHLEVTRNKGYFRGNLTGIKALYERFSLTHALILNPDVSCENWDELINVLYSKFESDKNCFIAGPKITIPGFSIVSSPIIPFLLWREIAYNLFFPFSNPVLKYFHTRLSKRSGKVFAVEGSAFMIDCKKAIDNQQYFDNIFLYGEETIFGKIAEKNHWNIYFDNSVEVLHHHPPGKTSPLYDKYLPLSYVEIAKKFYPNKMGAVKIFAAGIKYRFKIRKLLTRGK